MLFYATFQRIIDNIKMVSMNSKLFKISTGDNVRRNRLCIILFTALCLAGCVQLPHHIPYVKTPEGLNVTPLLSVELPGDFKNINALKKFASDRASKDNIKIKRTTMCGSDKDDPDILSLERINEHKGENRSIWFRRFETRTEALNQYILQKNIHLSNDHWLLYKEEGNEENKYFCSYEEPWWEVQHSVIIILNDSAKFVVVMLKGNLIIEISYDNYMLDDLNKDHPSFINELNGDISYAANLLRNAIENSPKIM